MGQLTAAGINGCRRSLMFSLVHRSRTGCLAIDLRNVLVGSLRSRVALPWNPDVIHSMVSGHRFVFSLVQCALMT